MKAGGRLGSVLLTLAILAACGSTEDLPTYRYRLTVEVATPEGRRSGSSVIEVRNRYTEGSPWPGGNGLSSSVRGEAAVVDLGSRGLLAAVLRTPNHEQWDRYVIHSVLPRPPVPRIEDSNLTFAKAAPKLRGRHHLPADEYPLLVRFSDRGKPSTATIIDPNDLSASFGPGVSLGPVTVEVTQDEVTQKVERQLPFLKERRPDSETLFDESPTSKQISLRSYDFLKEH